MLSQVSVSLHRSAMLGRASPSSGGASVPDIQCEDRRRPGNRHPAGETAARDGRLQ